MKIYFDCTVLKDWKGPVTGIPRVVECLASGFKNVKPDTVLFYFDDASTLFKDFYTHRPVFPLSNDWVFSAGPCWNYQGFLTVIESLKLSGTKYAHLYHDLIPVIFPYYYEPNFDRNFKQWAIRTFTLAEYAFAISDSTKNDLLKVTETKPETEKVITVRLGDNISPEGSSYNHSDKLPEGLKDFILCVGTLEARKNHRLLVDAIVNLVHDKSFKMNLVIVGREGWLPNNISAQLKADPVLINRVSHFDNLNDKDLSYLYNQCRFTVFPSFYEGWGLPVAESLKFEKPCIASDTMGVKEIGPDLTETASPYDLQQWIDLIMLYSNNEAFYLAKKKSIQENYKTTSWSSTVQTILNTIMEQGE